MSAYIQRFPGTRWTIVYGSNEGVEAFALEELNRMVQAYLPYVVEVRQADSIEPEARSGHVILGWNPGKPPLDRGPSGQKADPPAKPSGWDHRGLFSGGGECGTNGGYRRSFTAGGAVRGRNL